VLVEHGLAVLDLGGQPPGGDSIPAFGLRQLTGGTDDQSPTGGAFSLAAILDTHIRMIAPLFMRARLLTHERRRVSVASMNEFDSDCDIANHAVCREAVEGGVA
jgi:hypothetical protein